MSYIIELHYCCECGQYLGPDNGDGICGSCEDLMEECSLCHEFHMIGLDCCPSLMPDGDGTKPPM